MFFHTDNRSSIMDRQGGNQSGDSKSGSLINDDVWVITIGPSWTLTAMSVGWISWVLTFAEPVGTDWMALAIIIDVKVAGSGSRCETIGSVVRSGSRFLYLPNIFENALISLDSESWCVWVQWKEALNYIINIVLTSAQNQNIYNEHYWDATLSNIHVKIQVSWS